MKPSLAPLLPLLCTTPAIAQRLVLPDNHHLMESPSYGANEGDDNHWGTIGRRFQILYQASHFTGKAGVAGPITITRLRFRGEDGEANLGGQVYGNVQVQLGSTSLTAATMSATFATNRAAATTTMGPPGTVASLTVTPSSGSCPNDWCIDIDLAAISASHVHDPLGPRPNLLIDVTCPTPPVQFAPQFLIPIQDTTAHGAGIRGKSVYSNSPASLGGQVDDTPPVVGIEFSGGGGFPSELPARAEYIGGGCGGQHATIYQAFTQDQAFDLGAGLMFTPDTYPNPTAYSVTLGAAPLDATRLNAVSDSTADDALVAHNLGFQVQPFTYPNGGSTTDISASTNGVVWLDPAAASAAWQPTKANLLGTLANLGPRFMPFWSDLAAATNLGLGPQTGVHVQSVPETFAGAGDAVCYVTWWHTGAYRVNNATGPADGHEVFDFQVVLWERTGVVEFRYGTMPPFASTLWVDTMENAALVGFGLGRLATSPLVASLDPQSRDLSHELPFTTAVEGATSNVSLTALAAPIPGSPLQTARMFGGQALKWNVANIPAGSLFAMVNLDLGGSQPGLRAPPAFGITAPGCMISTTVDPLILGFESWILPPANVAGTRVLNVPHGWEGAVITAQAMGLDFAAGPWLIPWTSNTIKYTVGLD